MQKQHWHESDGEGHGVVSALIPIYIHTVRLSDLQNMREVYRIDMFGWSEWQRWIVTVERFIKLLIPLAPAHYHYNPTCAISCPCCIWPNHTGHFCQVDYGVTAQWVTGYNTCDVHLDEYNWMLLYSLTLQTAGTSQPMQAWHQCLNCYNSPYTGFKTSARRPGLIELLKARWIVFKKNKCNRNLASTLCECSSGFTELPAAWCFS